jgi:hypothetical protein
VFPLLDQDSKAATDNSTALLTHIFNENTTNTTDTFSPPPPPPRPPSPPQSLAQSPSQSQAESKSQHTQ